MTTASEIPLHGRAAPPMVNGEVTFDEPWQGRVFGMAHELARAGVFAWDDFRAELIARIAAWEAAHPDGHDYPYYDCFLEALERSLIVADVVDVKGLAERVAALARRPHDHDHHHDHRHDHD